MTQTSETAIARTVMQIAARSKDGIATYAQLFEEIPKQIDLTKEDRRESTTRNGEEMWQQIVRNIQSHHEAAGNAIAEGWLEHIPREGYRITALGRQKI